MQVYVKKETGKREVARIEKKEKREEERRGGGKEGRKSAATPLYYGWLIPDFKCEMCVQQCVGSDILVKK